MNNDKLEADLLDCIENGTNVNMILKDIAFEAGVEYKVNDIMCSMNASVDHIRLRWDDVLFVLRQDYLTLSYMNSFDDILKMAETIVANFNRFTDLSFKSIQKNRVPAHAEASKINTEENADEIECDLNEAAERIYHSNQTAFNSAGAMYADEDITREIHEYNLGLDHSKLRIDNQRSTAAPDVMMQPMAEGYYMNMNSNREAVSTGVLNEKIRHAQNNISTSVQSKYKRIFLLRVARLVFMAVDEHMAQPTPHYSDYAKYFSSIVQCILRLEPTLEISLVEAYERLFSKLAENCYLASLPDVDALLQPLIKMLDKNLSLIGSREHSDPRVHNLRLQSTYALSDKKLDIVECLSKEKTVDMGQLMHMTECMGRFINCFKYLLDSRIPFNHLQLISRTIEPYVSFLAKSNQIDTSLEFSIQSAELITAILLSQKISINLEPSDVEGAFVLLFTKLNSSLKKISLQNPVSMKYILDNLKRYFRVTATILAMRSGKSSNCKARYHLVNSWFFNSVRLLVAEAFSTIFFEPFDFECDFEFIEVLYSLLDIQTSLASFAKRHDLPLFSEMKDNLRRTAQHIVSQLEALDCPDKSITRTILDYVWQIDLILC